MVFCGLRFCAGIVSIRALNSCASGLLFQKSAPVFFNVRQSPRFYAAKMSKFGKIRVLTCGGGNGAHVMAALAASRQDTESRVLTLFADEAERWTEIAKTNDLTLQIKERGKEVANVVAKPSLVTKDASAAKGCDMIILTVPAFAHEQYFTAMADHIDPGTIIVGLPSQPGFEFQARHILGPKAKSCTFLSYETLPWACRISDYAKRVEVLGTKERIVGAVDMGQSPKHKDPGGILQYLMGKFPFLATKGHLLGITMMSVNSYIHTSILYGEWCGNEEAPREGPPLFYHGISEPTSNLLAACSAEIVYTARQIMAKHPEVDLNAVKSIYEWYTTCYPNDITDKTNLHSAIRSNTAYEGLTHPTKKTDDGKFLPNFEYRYLSEDVPYGLVVTKGIAKIAGVSTPFIDKVLYWCQKVGKREYMVNGELTGKDIGITRCPQRYGLKTIAEMLG